MTKREALEGHIKLWDWLAANPEKNKEDYPPFENINIAKDCYACEYNREQGGEFCRDNCIIPIFAENGHCLKCYSTSKDGFFPYSLWEGIDSLKDAAKYAKIIAGSGRDALKSLDKEENKK